MNFINKNIVIKVLDYIFFTRPVLFFPAITLLLLSSNGELFSVWELFSYINILASSYILNQIYDIENDKLNNKNYHLSKGIISLKEGCFLFFISSLFVFVYSISFYIFLVKLFLYISIVLFYNLPYFDWKGRPFLTLLSSFLGGSLTYLLGVDLTCQDFSIINFINYGNIIVVGSILTMIPDIEGDKICGKNSFAVHCGVERSLIVGNILSVIGIFLSLLSSDIFISSAFLLTIILNISRVAPDKSAKILILTLTFKAIYLYSVYTVPIALVFIIGRYYYKERFGIKYP